MNRNNHHPLHLPPEIAAQANSLAAQEAAMRAHVANVIQGTAVQIYTQLAAMQAPCVEDSVEPVSEEGEEWKRGREHPRRLEEQIADPEALRILARYAAQAAPFIAEALGLIKIETQNPESN